MPSYSAVYAIVLPCGMLSEKADTIVSKGVSGEETGSSDRVAVTPAVKFCWVNSTAWKPVPLGVLEKAMVKT